MAAKTTAAGSRPDNLDLEVAAKRLGVSKYTLRNWALYQRRVSYIRLGRRILFAPADLETFEQAGRVPARDPER
jgi:excisionase family DNA binding protein